MLSKVSKAIRATPVRQWFCAGGQGKPSGSDADGQTKAPESGKSNPMSFVKKGNSAPNKNQTASPQNAEQDTSNREGGTLFLKKRTDMGQPNKPQKDQSSMGEQAQQEPVKQAKMFNFREVDAAG
jgi:hypothetical protein